MRRVGTNEEGFQTYRRVADQAEMVLVPGGEFAMGTEEGNPSTVPVHEVAVGPYLLDAHEVTRGQYAAYSSEVAPRFPGKDWTVADDHPRDYVTWDEASGYCSWVGVRLPTEAEWEFAARGPDSLPFPWGSSWPPPEGAANVADEAARHLWTDVVAGYDDGFAGSAPVGSFTAGRSWCGVSDLAGNVEEWCADFYDPAYYASSPRENPRGPSAPLRPELPSYVARGGSFTLGLRVWLLSGMRRPMSGNAAFFGHGFRCAMDVPEGVPIPSAGNRPGEADEERAGGSSEGRTETGSDDKVRGAGEP